MDILKYLNENKEWLFSGLGIIIITLFLQFVKLLFKKLVKKENKVKHKKRKNMAVSIGKNNKAIINNNLNQEIDRDINISRAIGVDLDVRINNGKGDK